jgi:hypothetical protein
MDMPISLKINLMKDSTKTSAEIQTVKIAFGATLLTLTADGNSVILLEQDGQKTENFGIEKTSQVTAVITEEVNS